MRFLFIFVFVAVFPVVHMEAQVDETVFDGLHLRSSKSIRQLKDSLNKLAPVPTQLVAELDLYRKAQRMDETRLVLLIDSLLEEDALSVAMLHQIQLSVAQRQRDGELDGEDKKTWWTPMTKDGGWGWSSVEVRPGLDDVNLELRILGEFVPRFYFYSWTRSTAFRDPETNKLAASNYNIVDLYYNVFNGFFLVQETQFEEGLGTVLRAGGQYFVGAGDFSLILLSTVNVQDSRDLEFLSQWRYFPRLSPKTDAVFYLETLSILDQQGHLFSGERIRLGFRRMGFQVGGACDFKQRRNAEDPSQLDHEIVPALFFLKRF